MTGGVETGALWRRYAVRRDGETRAALVLAYWPLVKEVAASLRAKLPSHVEEGDMISAGLFGLLEAIERFDPSDAPRFWPFARARVRGAIIDEMRTLDWAPRQVRERARELDETRSALAQKLRRPATHAEVARALGITPDEVHVRLARNLLAQVAALDAEMVPEAAGETIRLIDTIEDEAADDPASSLAEDELRIEVIGVISELSWRERRVLTHHYRRGLSMREIGTSLGVSESRVSQIHSEVMGNLRHRILQLLPGETFPLRVVVEAAAEALERLDADAGMSASG